MSPNQFRIVVGSYEHNILCLSLDLSLETPVFTPVFHFQAHALSVKCLAIAGRYLVSGSNDEHIRIYDLQKRKELGTLLAHQGSITALQFSRRDAATAGSSSARWLLSASEDHRIIVWRVRDWENLGVLKGHTARVNDLDIHPSGRIAVSVSEDHSVRLWNLMTVKKAAVLKLRKYNQNGQAVRWLKRGDVENGGSHFAVALLTKVLVFAAADAKVHREIDLGRRTVMHIEVQTLPDGREYLCVGLSDGRVEFYDSEKLCVDTEEEEEEEEEEKPITPAFHVLGHTNRVKDFAFYTNEHGTYLVSIGSDGKAVVWEMTADSEPQQRAVYDCGERLNCLALCDEAVEKVDTMKKRLASGEDEERDLGEQSEPEDEDAAKLQRAMFGKRKRAKHGKGKGKSHVSVEL